MSTLSKSKRFVALHHVASGGVLVLKGLDKLEHGYLHVGAALFGLGVLLLAYFAFERFGQDRSRELAILVHACEGIAFLFVTYLYFAEAKTYLPWATLAAAIGFFIAALVHAWPGKAPSRHSLEVGDATAAEALFISVLGFRRANVEAGAVILIRGPTEVRLEESIRAIPANAGIGQSSPNEPRSAPEH